MADVQLKAIRKRYGDTTILQGIDLEVKQGEFMVFVGPSGCGKSTLLRSIAGLEDITEGELLIGGRRMNDVPPAGRGIAMVFQSYALYPHMNLYENMAFGLKLAKTPKAEIDRLVQHAAKILHIDHLLDRKPKDLSGGQRQRVAIGRAIVRKPEVFLFDEPLSNLDAALRVRMRYEFAKLHRELRSTMIYVTHDQVEAMTLADRIAVFQGGRLEQVGAPMALYHHPVNRFVAGFLGSPKMNFIQGHLLNRDACGAQVQLRSGHVLHCAVDASRLQPGDTVELGIRPEHITLCERPGSLQLELDFVESLGATTQCYFTLDGASEGLSAVLAGHQPLRQGQRLSLWVPPEHAQLFDAQGTAMPRLALAATSCAPAAGCGDAGLQALEGAA